MGDPRLQRLRAAPPLEYKAIETVARLGEGIGDHGSAFAHWAAISGTDPAALDEFEDRYLGHWSSLVEFAEHLLDDLGVDLDNLGPDNLQPYIRFDLEPSPGTSPWTCTSAKTTRASTSSSHESPLARQGVVETTAAFTQHL